MITVFYKYCHIKKNIDKIFNNIFIFVTIAIFRYNDIEISTEHPFGWLSLLSSVLPIISFMNSAIVFLRHLHLWAVCTISEVPGVFELKEQTRE